MLLARQSVEELSKILERAFQWEADRPVSRRCFGGSLLVHVLVFVPLIPLGQPAAARRQTVTPVIFQPLPAQEAAPPIQRPVPGPSNAAPLPEQGAAPEQVHVDIAGVKLGFSLDTRGEFPRVVESQHGFLALLDKGDPTETRYVLEPPDWRARESLRDTTVYFKIRMTPPRQWQVFRDAARDGIDLDHYQACALFEYPFVRCIKQAILARAAADGARSGKVASATLGVAAGQPCGIEVLEVSFASK